MTICDILKLLFSKNSKKQEQPKYNPYLSLIVESLKDELEEVLENLQTTQEFSWEEQDGLKRVNELKAEIKRMEKMEQQQAQILQQTPFKK